MKQIIFVISRSDIICEGIKEIIQSWKSIKTILIKEYTHIEEFEHFFNYNILIIHDTATFLDKDAILSLHKNNNVNILQLHRKKNNDNTKSIFLDDEKQSILRFINNIFTSNTNEEKEIRNNILSEREIQVLELLAHGNSNKTIADILNISTHTVISHRKNISVKTGIRSASGLTVFAIMNNLINTENIDPVDLI